jgi:pimeloyl-ACP methyl ester carboxylesterase
VSTTDTRTVTAADGTELHATVHGDGDTTYVLAHGWALSAHNWDSVRDLLHRAGARTVTYDQRCHGRSGRRYTPLSIDLLGADLYRIVETLAPTGKLVLAGHSMGGMTIMALAAAAPELIADRVSGVALVSTSAGDLTPQHNPARLVALAARHGSTVDTVRRLVSPALPAHQRIMRRMLFGTGTAPEVVRSVADDIQATPARTIAEFWPVLNAHDKIGALAALSPVPVEILVGSRDRLTPVRHARLLADRIAGARLTVLDGLGHMLPNECPELLARTLLRLPTTVPAR